MKKRILALLLVTMMVIMLMPMGIFAATDDTYADLVAYGKIFTSAKDGNGKTVIAEAFAMKDGKFIYVGDEEGAGSFIKGGKTQIIDHRGKGIITPGFYECHAHYLMGNGKNLMGGPTFDQNTTVEQLKEVVAMAYDQAKAAGKTSIFGFGWVYQAFMYNMPTIQELDAICPDVALFLNDAEGHKGLANTLCLQNAGILDESGNVLISNIRGGEICMTDGKPNGLLTEQAVTYVRNHGINFNEIFPATLGKQAVAQSQEQLLSQGYVGYMDGWSNYYGNDSFYEGAKALEDEGKLNMLLGMSYEFDSSAESVEDELAKAIQMKKYTDGHINADYVKIFIDGTVESGTGFTIQPYQATQFGHGIANWEQAEVNEITEWANNNGLTMHVHAMGDAAVNRAVNAFVDKGKKELRNTVVHTRNVPQADFQRMADNNIVAVSGILWHNMETEIAKALAGALPLNLIDKNGWPMAYPMKSYFDAGAIMTSHSDYPATSGSPADPLGIMEIAVTGQMHTGDGLTDPFWVSELISREEALQALTINGAYQMHVENERGSIEVGKYADFAIVDKDILTCPKMEIHTANVVSTWFEGEQVYGNYPVKVSNQVSKTGAISRMSLWIMLMVGLCIGLCTYLIINRKRKNGR